jgi:hypothetical protein
MFILVYMYHSGASFFNLLWIILSFILSMEHTFALSIVVMIPILSWEFFLIYGMRIRVVNETYFFKEYGSYFRWQMK